MRWGSLVFLALLPGCVATNGGLAGDDAVPASPVSRTLREAIDLRLTQVNTPPNTAGVDPNCVWLTGDSSTRIQGSAFADWVPGPSTGALVLGAEAGTLGAMEEVAWQEGPPGVRIELPATNLTEGRILSIFVVPPSGPSAAVRQEVQLTLDLVVLGPEPDLEVRSCTIARS